MILLKFKPDYIEQDEINKSIEELAQVYEELPKQLIHRDVHLGNFLFDNSEFSGYKKAKEYREEFYGSHNNGSGSLDL